MYRGIIAFFSFWLLIDMINGILIFSSVGFEFTGKILKGMIILLGIILVVLNRNGRRVILVPLILYLIASAILLIVLFGNANFIDNHFKLLSLIVLTELIRLMILDGNLDLRDFKKIIRINYIIIAMNIVLSVVGIGRSFYSTGQGARGFFYAGNEVAVTFISLVLISLWLIQIFKVSRLVSVIVILGSIFGAIGILNKTAVVGVGLIFIYTYFIRSPIKAVGLVLFLSSIFIVFRSFINEKLLMWAGRTEYFINTYGLSTVLLGGQKRLDYVAEIISDFNQKPILWVTGRGWVGQSENNLFDVIEAFGIPGIIFYAIWIFYILNMVNVALKNGFFLSYRIDILLFGILLVLGISILAGHTLQSNMLALFAAMILNSSLLIKNINLRSKGRN